MNKIIVLLDNHKRGTTKLTFEMATMIGRRLYNETNKLIGANYQTSGTFHSVVLEVVIPENNMAMLGYVKQLAKLYYEVLLPFNSKPQGRRAK
jgi:hypothetical protein